MQTLTRTIKKNAALIFFGAMLPAMVNTSWAESDKQLQEKTLKAREMMNQKDMDHSAHMNMGEQKEGFRGVFYGYLPCEQKGCDGFKMTLSLKPKSNYLLVTQYAKESSREYYDKGKFNWDDTARMLTLTSNKDGSKRLFKIKDDGTLIHLNNNGTPMPGDQDDYTLERSDKAKSREVHIH